MRGCARERGHRRAARSVSAAVAFALVLLTDVPMTWGDFADNSAESHTISTAALSAPTGPGTSPGTCVVAVGDSLVVSWTRTASTWAEGYDVLRSTSSGGPYSVVATAAGLATESYVDSGLAFSTTYYYVVRATKVLWQSPVTPEVSRSTRSPSCL